jgi:hypothetical protein
MACQLCRLMHEKKRPTKIIENIREFWSPRDCVSGFVDKLLVKPHVNRVSNMSFWPTVNVTRRSENDSFTTVTE